MANKRQAQQQSEYAKWMKANFVIRRTARCPVCYRIVAVPMDRHFFGGNCN